MHIVNNSTQGKEYRQQCPHTLPHRGPLKPYRYTLFIYQNTIDMTVFLCVLTCFWTGPKPGLRVRVNPSIQTQSAGLVKRQDGDLKNRLAKLCSGTGLKWTMMLLLALMSVRSTPIRKHKLPPHDIITIRPMTVPRIQFFAWREWISMPWMSKWCCSALSASVQSIHRQVKAVHYLPSDQPCNDIQHSSDRRTPWNFAGPNHIGIAQWLEHLVSNQKVADCLRFNFPWCRCWSIPDT